MVVLKSVLFIVMLAVLSMALGKGIVLKSKKENIIMAHCYVVGILGMFSLFHVLAVIFTFLDLSLTALVTVYLVLLIVLLFCLYRGNWKMRLPVKRKRTDSKYELLFWIVLGLILFQVFYVCIFSHTDADDATYVGIATTALATDTLNHFNPLTGVEMKLAEMVDYKLAPFSLFWAMWAKVFVLHPAFVMHTLCPVLLITMAYAVYYLIGRVFFKDKKKVYEFLLFVCLLNIWGNWAIRSTSSFLLFRIWQGKAVLAAVLIPLTIYLMAQVWKDDARQLDWTLLFLNSVSCCFVSGMGAMIFPVLLVAYAVSDLVVTKRWLRMRCYIVCLIPCMVSAVLYIALRYLA